MTIGHLPPIGQDLDVNDVLLRVRDLVDTAMAHNRTELLTYLPDGPAVRTSLRTMVRGARQSVRCVAVSAQFAEELFEAIAAVPGWNNRTGPVIKIMVSPAEQVIAAVSRWAERYHCEIRVTPSLTRDLVVVDGEQLLTGPSACGREAMVSSCPNLIDLLSSAQWPHWGTAHSLEWHRRADRINGRPMAQEIIALLAKGYKDDTAAQRLGVSVRTFRRHVADLLREVDVRSRFQFGICAEQLGLTHDDEMTKTRRRAS